MDDVPSFIRLKGEKMGIFFDLHRHDEFSFFDGFGKASELAKIAKEYGYPALGISNHGNITGLVQHWLACRENGIKPVFGCEVYFQPKFKKSAPERKSYHLCLFVKNIVGYRNLCHMMTEANKEQFYYKPIIDFGLLEKYKEGIICTTACIASATSQAANNGNEIMLLKLMNKFKSIFEKDLYVELQPYSVDNNGTQEKVNLILMNAARQCGIKCILTSDSHYGKKDDFDTYCKMHEIGRTTLDVKNTYGERYMPTEYEIMERFAVMYKNKIRKSFEVAESFVDNMKQIFDSVEDDILSQCELVLPKISRSENDSNRILKQKIKEGLKKRGKWEKREYRERCLRELEVIHYHGFDDYFLMVQNYVNWARDHGVAVGPGRGSACNCLVAYAVGITDVDSIKYNLDFSRFMRKEKKKLPDIDVDFETSKRQSVIDYVVEKYPGRAVQICSYGEYKIDGLINDLASVCGLKTTKEEDEYDRKYNAEKIAEIKKHVRSFEEDGKINMAALLSDEKSEEYNSLYDGIIRHFSRLYKKVRHLGQHAAGVAVVGSDISDYTCMVRKTKDKKVTYVSCYDLNDLEYINCTKFDMLGLQTMSEIFELEELTGHKITEEDRENPEIYRMFREGKTDGIFQMEKSAPKKILNMVHCDDINDVIAVNALNRPAPLQLKMHETYAKNKLSGRVDKNNPYYKYTSETYGTMLYQEQTVEVAQKLGHLSADQSFSLLKIMKKPENLQKAEYVPIIEQMKKDFFAGCRSEGLTKEQTNSIWLSMLIYGFNKGHSTGYSIISVDQMVYKTYYSTEFWYVKMKYARDDSDVHKYSALAAKSGAVVMIPHVNYSCDKTSLRVMDGGRVIQQGLSILKDVGSKAAEAIERERKENGMFLDYDDFYDRCKGRTVTERVIRVLYENGALELNEKKYARRVIAYNSMLINRR